VLLRDVRAINRNAVKRAGGLKVDTHGDEFFAVFDDPASALRAAIEIQLAMDERAWPQGVKVRVRAGVHSGRPTLTDTGYIGLSVHTVARICSVAHGGQIVVSGKCKAALDPRMPADIRLRSLGRHRLTGMPKPEPLYQVEAKGLRTRFPPLRTPVE
jgi:class 3 adenylate cyclase